MCDAMSYDGYSIEEFGKLEKIVRDMKTHSIPAARKSGQNYSHHLNFYS